MKTTECSEMNKQLLANLKKIEQLTTKVFFITTLHCDVHDKKGFISFTNMKYANDNEQFHCYLIACKIRS